MHGAEHAHEQRQVAGAVIHALGHLLISPFFLASAFSLMAYLGFSGRRGAASRHAASAARGVAESGAATDGTEKNGQYIAHRKNRIFLIE